MAVNIGPKIGIEGEAEYRKGIQNIINDAKLLKSEVNALTSSYDKEKVSIKDNNEQRRLQQQLIDNTKKKLQEQEAMLERSATALDKNGQHTAEMAEKTKQWQIVVNNTQAELNKLEAELKNMPTSIDIVADRMKKAGDSMIDFGNGISNIGGKLTMALTAPITAAAGAGVAYNANLEQLQTMFTTLTGSAEEADRIISQLQQDASKSPFDTSSLVQANQYLISAGVNSDDARKTINDLGNAIAATGGGSAELQRMAQNLQQVKNIGKASSMDIKQFANAGINIYGLLAEATGKTTEQVKDMEVSYEVLVDALSKASEEGGRYFGAMEAQSETLTGSVNALKEQFSQLLGDLTKELVPVIKQVLKGAKDLLTRIKQMTPEQKKMIVTVAGIAAAIGPLLTGMGKAIIFAGNITKAMAALAPVLKAAKAGMVAVKVALGGMLGPIAAAIAAIAAIIVVIKNWGTISTWLTNTWNTAKAAIISIFSSLHASASAIFENMRNAITSAATNAYNSAANIFNNMRNAIVNAVSNAYNGAINTFNNLKNGAINIINNMWSGITGAIENVKNAIVNGLSGAFSWITNQVNNARTWGRDLIDNMANGIRGAISGVTNAVSSVANRIRSYLHFTEPDIGPLSNFHTWMPDMMKGLAEGINKNQYLVDSAIARVADSLAIGSGSTDVNYGGVSIYLNVPEGANGQMLVDQIETEIANRTLRRQAVFG